MFPNYSDVKIKIVKCRLNYKKEAARRDPRPAHPPSPLSHRAISTEAFNRLNSPQPDAVLSVSEPGSLDH